MKFVLKIVQSHHKISPSFQTLQQNKVHTVTQISIYSVLNLNIIGSKNIAWPQSYLEWPYNNYSTSSPSIFVKFPPWILKRFWSAKLRFIREMAEMYWVGMGSQSQWGSFPVSKSLLWKPELRGGGGRLPALDLHLLGLFSLSPRNPW